MLSSTLDITQFRSIKKSVRDRIAKKKRKKKYFRVVLIKLRFLYQLCVLINDVMRNHKSSFDLTIKLISNNQMKDIK
jgi:hypothetical protein